MSLLGSTTLDWPDANKRGVIMWKVPRNIKMNDNIVVREDEYAVFYRDGKALTYIDRPDRYALTSLNAPIVGKLVQLLSGVKQWAEVYYLQKKPFDAKFGSKQPYQFKDKDFGIVNLRLFGECRYRVTVPENFINEFVGTLNYSTADEVTSRIQEQVVLLTYDVLGDMKAKGLGVTDFAASLTNIEQFVLERAKDHFELYGIEIQKLSGLYISMPEEVQKAVDARSSMQVLGTDYIGYQTGQAMREAAQNPSGGAAGTGVGLGAGIGMGYMMMDSMGRRVAAPGGPAAGLAPAGMVPCTACGALIPAGSKFCPTCGATQATAKPCIKCGQPVPASSKFCPNCGTVQGGTVKCPKCGKEAPAGTKFCPDCGSPIP
jgi:membrane protease subunit (stomatin/prohibitin family)